MCILKGCWGVLVNDPLPAIAVANVKGKGNRVREYNSLGHINQNVLYRPIAISEIDQL
jgi:hypothetical protein